MKQEIKEEEDDEISRFTPKACGFFPWRLRNEFCHLNPVSHSARMKKKKPLSFLPTPNRGNAPHNLSDGELKLEEACDESDYIPPSSFLYGGIHSPDILRLLAVQGTDHSRAHTTYVGL